MSLERESIRGCSESWFSVGWGAVEPDPFTFAVSRGAGGGRGGVQSRFAFRRGGLQLGPSSGPRFPDA